MTDPQSTEQRPEDAALDEAGLAAWGLHLLEETYAEWLVQKGSYPFWDLGFSVFGSPIALEPALLLIGPSPGADDAAFVPRNARALPAVHDYFKPNPSRIALQMRRLFTDMKLEPALAASVRVNVNFFRSHDSLEWGTAPPDIRRHLEAFSVAKIAETVATLAPKLILCEGRETYVKLRDGFLAKSEALPICNAQQRQLLWYCRLPDQKQVVGIIHPTSRLTPADWQLVSGALKDLIEGRTPGEPPTSGEQPPIIEDEAVPLVSAPDMAGAVKAASRAGCATAALVLLALIALKRLL